MKKLMIVVSALMTSAAAWASASFAYQGVLKMADGTSVGTQKTITFRLYKTQTDTDALWARQANVQLDANGLFNVEISDSLGSGSNAKTLDDVLQETQNGNLYLGLTVKDSAGEITPRQKVSPTPFAAMAQDVVQAKKDFTVAGQATIKGDLTVSGNTLTAKKVVASEEVLAQKGITVTGKTTLNGAVALNSTLSVGSTLTVNGVEVLPKGAIIMWSGNQVPNGWALCNGQTVNGMTTPDLRNRFIVGAGNTYQVGNTGGADSVKLTVNQMPKHKHEFKFSGADIDDGWKDQNNLFAVNDNIFNGKYKNTRNTEEAGGDQAHENRPPYYALSFIMKVK